MDQRRDGWISEGTDGSVKGTDGSVKGNVAFDC